jgi:hypothetical protein
MATIVLYCSVFGASNDHYLEQRDTKALYTAAIVRPIALFTSLKADKGRRGLPKNSFREPPPGAVSCIKRKHI